MNLSLSNLALPNSTGPSELRALFEAGLEAIEVAPTRIAPWEQLLDDRLQRYRETLQATGLRVSSLQALFYQAGELSLLETPARFEAMIQHVDRIARIGTALGARIGVFGAPKQRRRGELLEEAAWELGRERLSKLAQVAENQDFVLGLEHVPAAYGGDFLCSPEQVIRMVREVDRAGLRVHLDVGCAFLGGDDIALAVREAGELLAHFHASEPKLGSFADPQSDHASAARALRESGFRGHVAIEMLEQSPEPMDSVMRALAFVSSTYGPQA